MKRKPQNTPKRLRLAGFRREQVHMSRLHKAKARAGLYGSVENRIDDELFSMFLDLAESVLHCAA